MASAPLPPRRTSPSRSTQLKGAFADLLAAPAPVSPSAFPAVPFKIPDNTPPQQRANLLDAMIPDGAKDPEVRAWADEKFLEALEELGEDITPCRLAAYGLAVVQREITYSLEKPDNDPASDWFQPAAYTLKKKRGQCEHMSVLLGALYYLWRIESRIVWIYQPQFPIDHVTLQAFVDGCWQWAESTIPGARFSEGPYHAAERLGNVRSLHGGGALAVA